jgi:type IV secretion system protein TrbD
MNLRRIAFYRALWRSQLFLGGERELVLFVTGVAILIAMNGMNLIALVTAVLLWCLAVPALRWVAKQDPQFSKVYTRHINQRRFYRARSTPWKRD